MSEISLTTGVFNELIVLSEESESPDFKIEVWDIIDSSYSRRKYNRIMKVMSSGGDIVLLHGVKAAKDLQYVSTKASHFYEVYCVPKVNQDRIIQLLIKNNGKK